MIYIIYNIEVYRLPSSCNAVLKLEDQIHENRKTIREILCMEPYEHKLNIFLDILSSLIFFKLNFMRHLSCIEIYSIYFLYETCTKYILPTL
jgi:hypothetical protein